jgi:formate dehydrogenase gamma subunit
MTPKVKSTFHPTPASGIQRVFWRFTTGQRWEHWLLFFSFTTLLLTGLPQKYRSLAISQAILSTPERVHLLQTIHHYAAFVLILEVLYHLGKIVMQLVQRRLSGEMLITWQDVKDSFQMVKYLLFLTDKKPAFGKYNFEQKLTYWFLFFGIGIMVLTGIVLLYPIQITWVLPGGIIPAAKLAHSEEAIVAAVFIVIWHFFHVHLERLNLSMFTGWLNADEERKYHAKEYETLVQMVPEDTTPGGE